MSDDVTDRIAIRRSAKKYRLCTCCLERAAFEVEFHSTTGVTHQCSTVALCRACGQLAAKAIEEACHD